MQRSGNRVNCIRVLSALSRIGIGDSPQRALWKRIASKDKQPSPDECSGSDFQSNLTTPVFSIPCICRVRWKNADFVSIRIATMLSSVAGCRGLGERFYSLLLQHVLYRAVPHFYEIPCRPCCPLANQNIPRREDRKLRSRLQKLRRRRDR